MEPQPLTVECIIIAGGESSNIVVRASTTHQLNTPPSSAVDRSCTFPEPKSDGPCSIKSKPSPTTITSMAAGCVAGQCGAAWGPCADCDALDAICSRLRRAREAGAGRQASERGIHLPRDGGQEHPLVCAVASGLAVGKEGPFIHLVCCVAHMLASRLRPEVATEDFRLCHLSAAAALSAWSAPSTPT
jgi:hypothetical protein